MFGRGGGIVHQIVTDVLPVEVVISSPSLSFRFGVATEPSSVCNKAIPYLMIPIEQRGDHYYFHHRQEMVVAHSQTPGM